MSKSKRRNGLAKNVIKILRSEWGIDENEKSFKLGPDKLKTKLQYEWIEHVVDYVVTDVAIEIKIKKADIIEKIIQKHQSIKLFLDSVDSRLKVVKENGSLSDSSYSRVESSVRKYKNFVSSDDTGNSFSLGSIETLNSLIDPELPIKGGTQGYNEYEYMINGNWHSYDDITKNIEGYKKEYSIKKNNNSVDESLTESSLLRILTYSKNLIIEGVPGTGKTYAIKHEICYDWPQKETLKGQGTGAYAITLHPATSYEDFVEGLRPATSASILRSGEHCSDPQPAIERGLLSDAKAVSLTGNLNDKVEGTDLCSQRYFHVIQEDASHDSTTSQFKIQDGFFLRVCAEAVNNPNSQYVILLDEINRCNVPKVMGDLLTTLERSKRAQWESSHGGYWNLSKCQVVTLPNSQRLFFVPDNVYVVATMNTTDRSVAPLDAALRRRFAFVRLWPKGFNSSCSATEVIQAWRDDPRCDEEVCTQLKEEESHLSQSLSAWAKLNEKLRARGPDAMLGHSYLFDLATDLASAESSEHADIVAHHWNYHILPQLIDLAVNHHFETELVQPGADGTLGELTQGLFQDTGFTLHGYMPESAGLLAVPTLTLSTRAPTIIESTDSTDSTDS